MASLVGIVFWQSQHERDIKVSTSRIAMRPAFTSSRHLVLLLISLGSMAIAGSGRAPALRCRHRSVSRGIDSYMSTAQVYGELLHTD